MEGNMTNQGNEEFDIEESFQTIDEIDADSVTLRDVQEVMEKTETKSDTLKAWTYRNMNKIILVASIIIVAIIVAATLGLIYGRNKNKSNTNTNQPQNTEPQNDPQNSKLNPIIPEPKYTTKFRLPSAEYESLNDESNKSEFLKKCTQIFEESPKKIECIGAEKGSIIVEIQSEFEPQQLQENVSKYLEKVDQINGHSTRGYHFYSELKITKPISDDVLQLEAGEISTIDLSTNAAEEIGITYSVYADDEQLTATINGNKLDLFTAEDTTKFEYNIILTAVNVNNEETTKEAITVKVTAKPKNGKQQNKNNKKRDKMLEVLDIPDEREAKETNRFLILSNEETDQEDNLSDKEDGTNTVAESEESVDIENKYLKPKKKNKDKSLKRQNKKNRKRDQMLKLLDIPDERDAKDKNLNQKNKKNKKRDQMLEVLDIPDERDAKETNRFSILLNEENGQEDDLSEKED